MEPDADLQDAVIEIANRCGRGAPEDLQRLVLLEELARIELLDASCELGWWRVTASRARGLVRRAGRRSLWRACRFAGPTIWLGRARARGSFESEARPR